MHASMHELMCMWGPLQQAGDTAYFPVVVVIHTKLSCTSLAMETTKRRSARMATYFLRRL